MLHKLRPTVKRDLSLFSALAWESGYTNKLKEDIGFWYDLFLHYDGEKINFYHRLSDFEHFKTEITPQLIKNNALFNSLVVKFKRNIKNLQKHIGNLNANDLPEVFNLIAEIMSLYIFIVSDDFVKEKPKAWELRKMSEGILYETDKKIEQDLQKILIQTKLPSNLKHFLTPPEIERLKNNEKIDLKKIGLRKKEYIIFKNELITNQSFPRFCRSHNLKNPKEQTTKISKKLTGQPAYGGKAKGSVKIVKKLEDIKKVRKGDILVAIMTNIKYLPAMKRAAAVVTDEGGITSHAAIAAREFKIPTIMGTKTATQIFEDGDLVQINANLGTIEILKSQFKK